MTDIELAALTALLASETVQSNEQVMHGDGLIWDPNTYTRKAIYKEMERRKLLPTT